MKHLLTSLVLILIPSLTVLVVPLQSAVAADVVGNEKQEVCWRGVNAAEEFQLYFGQTDQVGRNDKPNTIWGLSRDSKCLTLNNLKACTTYNWNLNALRGGKWNWQWTSDQKFTTGGVCPAAVASTTQVTTSAGTKAIVVGTAKATASWPVTDGASNYNVYYKVCGQSKYAHAVTVSDKGQSVEISYLNPNVRYCYQAVPVVNSKELWNKNPEKVLRESNASQPVLGTSTSQDMSRFSDEGRVYYRNPSLDQQPEDTSMAYRYENTEDATAYNYTNPKTGGIPNRYMNNVLGDSSMPTTLNMSPTRVSSWSTKVHSSDMKNIHVYFWSSQTDKHAVRDLSGDARKVTINHLNTGRTYHYSVQAVMNDGTTTWLAKDKVL